MIPHLLWICNYGMYTAGYEWRSEMKSCHSFIVAQQGFAHWFHPTTTLNDSQFTMLCKISFLFLIQNQLYRLSQKKLQPAFGYRLQKNPLWNQQNQTGLWNYGYFPTIQWRPHLIWPNNHKEIWIFVMQVTGPFFPSFVTWMYMNVCGFHRQIVFTKGRLSNIFKFHAYLSNKGCSWQPKTLSDM